ncbi:DMT family transporter [Desulfofustis glycolicus]|uniref:Permease of the drug/metabolite transporter (DMT) superfamily n=1 Tax=Desulfofustis glycolicus DSM 9705 TaxID=1121409 RepID=A0A1M5VI93_9BACT|nr:DMT family transporter [Desulfofustis glycolicus]SHH74966.1 Permease of the drug/metabolite transporter (DMT) superfamily [Desulfofustis glycolicus DSM 9705]
MAGKQRQWQDNTDHWVRIHLLMLLCATLVSTSFVVGEHIAVHLDPAALTLSRFVIAVLILLPVIAVRHGLRIGLLSFLRYALISGSLVVFFWCMFLALRMTTALNTSVLFTLVPGLSAIYAALIIKERLGRDRLVALLLGLVGAVWVIFRGDLHVLLTLSWNRGDAVFFAGCLAMGLYTPLIRRLHRGEPMEVMTFWVLVSGCLWLLPIGAVALSRVDWLSVPPSTWGWIVYLACFTTVITFYLTQYAVAHIGPTRTMSYSYLYPGLVLIIDLLLGRGWPAPRVLPGIIVILGAMVVLQVPVFRRYGGKN